MIPKNIQREHIIKATEEADRVEIPKGRSSKKFFLEYNGEYYPPKYIISLANKYANGKELDSSEFGGGKETNNFLRAMGFNIIDKTGILKPPKKINKIQHLKTHHNERCPKCKETIKKLLEKIYGKVEPNYKFKIGTYLEYFSNSIYHDRLKEIHKALQNHRGFKNFIRAKTLPRCDFFIPDPGLIVEFDESQHFTLPRKISLEHYSEELALGFDRKRWTILCEEIHAKDNDPPFRDEQRAWYDTIRDFLPMIKGFGPTVRLYARQMQWCSLDPNNPSDVKRFDNILKRTSKSWEIMVREDLNPFLARIIIAGEWDGDQENAKRLLEDICNNWPKGKMVKFVVTCGGFIQFNWPENISRKDIGDKKYPNSKVVKTLVEEANKCAEFIINGGLDKKLRKYTDYITLGIDSRKEKISITQNYISQPHIELVFLVDLRNNKLYWTGKSYPTTKQQDGLIRISDLGTHFVKLEDVGKAMILGCHDLTIFNPRSKNAKGWREKLNSEFRKLAQDKDPIIVLQHPHTSDCINVWTAAWNNLRKSISAVKKYASAGRWPHSGAHLYKKGRRKGKPHCNLSMVREKTKCGNTIDFIVCMNTKEDSYEPSYL